MSTEKIAAPPAAAGGSCEACPAHHAANLIRLGVNMANWAFVVALAGNPNTGKTTVLLLAKQTVGKDFAHKAQNDYFTSRPRADATAAAHEVVCYAESDDGIVWTRPVLGLVEAKGSKENNIVLNGTDAWNLSVFKDANPAANDSERYQAIARGPSVDGRNERFGGWRGWGSRIC